MVLYRVSLLVKETHRKHHQELQVNIQRSLLLFEVKKHTSIVSFSSTLSFLEKCSEKNKVGWSGVRE